MDNRLNLSNGKVIAWFTPSLILLMTALFGTKGKLETDKKCGPLNQLLSCQNSADIPGVSALAVLSLVAMWFHWSTLLNSKILQKRFLNKGWLLFIRVNTLEIGRALCPHEYLVNSYSKCPNSFVLQPSGK